MAQINILRIPQTLQKTGLRRSTFYKLLASGGFPKKVILTERTIGFIESEVDAWLESRAASRSA